MTGVFSPSTLLYVYAILPDATTAEHLLDTRTIPGVHPAEGLFALRAAGLTVAVSNVPAAQFHEDALNALLQDAEQVGPYALRHDEAIRALMNHVPALIPLAFGTVFVSVEGIVGLLESNAQQFRGVLDELAGKQEWTLKAYTDAERLAAAAELSTEARRLGEEAATNSPGRAFLLQKQREQVVADEAARLRDNALQDVMDRVAQVATKVQLDDIPEQETAVQTLALKAAILVETKQEDALQSALTSSRAKYESAGLLVEVNGPWPPYSFVGRRQ